MRDVTAPTIPPPLEPPSTEQQFLEELKEIILARIDTVRRDVLHVTSQHVIGTGIHTWCMVLSAGVHVGGHGRLL